MKLYSLAFVGFVFLFSESESLFLDWEKNCFANPEDTCAELTEYLLFTREKQHENLTDGSLQELEAQIEKSHFSTGRDTKCIIHGYTDSGYSQWAIGLANTILNYYDVNVIVVNWAKSADNLNYGQAAANTRGVGQAIAKVIKATKADPKSFHLIGHSLGSHVAGYAGHSLNGTIGRITGLDPAGLCFRLFTSKDYRLSEDDAVFVDAIHTDADMVLQGGFGTGIRMGHADFYPNGGENQPGCGHNWWDHTKKLFTGWTGGFMESLTCSHIRVLGLFEESLDRTHGFNSCKCKIEDVFKTCSSAEKTNHMGFYADPTQEGVFALETNSGWPFSKELN